ncbi:cell envelope integrity protein TolA [Atlantibacter hermannii]|uniref:cell envelope integrity protein TolA n=1 Tax=Atlantibacter hermannii TaxID=565 RepID=UPI003244BFAB
MHVFKLAALAAVLFTTAAHAAVDCARPLSVYGYRMAEKYPIYQAYRADFDTAFTAFCEAGKQYAADGMPYEAANQRTGIEAARWMRERFADDIPAGAIRSGLESLVYMGGWSGYTGEAWPPAPAAARPAPKKRAAEKPGPVDDLFGDLSSGKNAAPTGRQTQEPRTASSKEISRYTNQLRDNIKQVFYSVDHQTGKQCRLAVELTADGKVLNVAPRSGDLAFCRAAMEAVKRADMPELTPELYPIFKKFEFDFKP